MQCNETHFLQTGVQFKVAACKGTQIEIVCNELKSKGWPDLISNKVRMLKVRKWKSSLCIVHVHVELQLGLSLALSHNAQQSSMPRSGAPIILNGLFCHSLLFIAFHYNALCLIAFHCVWLSLHTGQVEVSWIVQLPGILNINMKCF